MKLGVGRLKALHWASAPVDGLDAPTPYERKPHMKAILFTAAALTAGICAASINSANTVGYLQPESFHEKFTMFGPMFAGIGTQTEGSYEVDIQALKPVGENVPDGSDTKNIIQIFGTSALPADPCSDAERLCRVRRVSRHCADRTGRGFCRAA